MAARVHVFLLVRCKGQPERVVVWDTQDISVGRDPENDVVLGDPEMSPSHALFRRDGGAFLVDGRSSSSPTLVNGQAVTSQALEARDVVQVAETQIVFCRSTENPVTLGIKTEYASQLKGFGPKLTGDGEMTVLGLMDAVGGDEAFQVRPSGDLDHELAGMSAPPAPRNLDLGGGLDMPGSPASGTVSLSLEIEGLSPEQGRFLRSLLGKAFRLPPMRIRLKGDDLG